MLSNLQFYYRLDEEFHNLNRSPHRVRIKSGRSRWVGYIAGMEEGRSVFNIVVGNLQKRHL